MSTRWSAHCGPRFFSVMLGFPINMLFNNNNSKKTSKEMQLVENANVTFIGTKFILSHLTLFATAFGNNAAAVRNL